MLGSEKIITNSFKQVGQLIKGAAETGCSCDSINDFFGGVGGSKGFEIT